MISLIKHPWMPQSKTWYHDNIGCYTQWIVLWLMTYTKSVCCNRPFDTFCYCIRRMTIHNVFDLCLYIFPTFDGSIVMLLAFIVNKTQGAMWRIISNKIMLLSADKSHWITLHVSFVNDGECIHLCFNTMYAIEMIQASKVKSRSFILFV